MSRTPTPTSWTADLPVEVIAICPTPRTAWIWLRRPFSFLDGRTPLEALRNGELTAVFAVSHQLFDPC